MRKLVISTEQAKGFALDCFDIIISDILASEVEEATEEQTDESNKEEE